MAVVKISDAPFDIRIRNHLKLMGVVEADWGHPEVVLEDPIAYFKERIRLKDNPTIQMKEAIISLPSLRGTNLRDDYRHKVLHNPDSEPTSLRIPPAVVK